MRKGILDVINSAAAGFAGAAVLLLLAFALHWGGLGQDRQAQQSATAASGDTGTATQQLTAAPAPGSTMSPEQIYQKYAESAVQIVSTFPSSSSDFFQNSQGTQQGIGFGFVISSDGYILTNAHVVTDDSSVQSGGSSVKASEVEVDFTDGKKAKAQIVGYDLTSSDVAVLKVDPKGLNLVPAVLGDSDKVQVGEPVVAIGSPFGVYSSSLTSGVVSAVNRSVESPQAGFTINNAIQTDAAINRGNSGGPLFDDHGEVIGLNEQIATTSGGSEGVGFAVPINTAKKVKDQIITTGTVDYAFMGVVGQTVDKDLAQQNNLPVDHGALITDVQSGSPADQAGIQKNDIIISIDGHDMNTMEDVTGYLVQKKPGDQIKVTVRRGNGTKDLQVKLGKRPTS